MKVHDDFLNHRMKKLIIHVVGIKNAATGKDKNTKEGILTIELRNIPKYFFEEHRQLIAQENSKESNKSEFFLSKNEVIINFLFCYTNGNRNSKFNSLLKK